MRSNKIKIRSYRRKSNSRRNTRKSYRRRNSRKSYRRKNTRKSYRRRNSRKSYRRKNTRKSYRHRNLRGGMKDPPATLALAVTPGDMFIQARMQAPIFDKIEKPWNLIGVLQIGETIQALNVVDDSKDRLKVRHDKGWTPMRDPSNNDVFVTVDSGNVGHRGIMSATPPAAPAPAAEAGLEEMGAWLAEPVERETHQDATVSSRDQLADQVAWLAEPVEHEPHQDRDQLAEQVAWLEQENVESLIKESIHNLNKKRPFLTCGRTLRGKCKKVGYTGSKEYNDCLKTERIEICGKEGKFIDRIHLNTPLTPEKLKKVCCMK